MIEYKKEPIICQKFLYVRSKKMSYPYLYGKKIHLKNIEEKDIEQLLVLENEPIVRLFGDDDIPYPVTKESLTKFIHLKVPNHTFGIFDNESKELVGNIAIFDVNQVHLHCEFSIMIGDSWQGNGFGKEAIHLIVDFIFNYLPSNKIKLQVFSFNEKAIHLYKKCGFKHEGTLREELFRFGKFQNIENFSLLRSEWKSEFYQLETE